MITELEDMKTIYEILSRHKMDAQMRMLEWVAKITDEENSKKLHEERQAKIGQLMSEETLKMKAP